MSSFSPSYAIMTLIFSRRDACIKVVFMSSIFRNQTTELNEKRTANSKVFRLKKKSFVVFEPLEISSTCPPLEYIAMASNSPSVAITAAPPKKMAVYGLGQFGFAMTELFSAKHPSIPIEAYDPVTVRHLPRLNSVLALSPEHYTIFGA